MTKRLELENRLSSGDPEATAEGKQRDPVTPGAMNACPKASDSPASTRISNSLESSKTRAPMNADPEKPDFPTPPPHQIRLSGPLEHDNIVNGYGLRAVLWTQGCPNHCPGCQNPETWSFESGMLVDIADVKARLREFRGQAGITFCGGEPFVQPRACKEIADWCRAELGWNIWSFSGFTYDQIMEMGGDAVAFLKTLDALIDGPFVLAERDLTLKFRGSRNQRLLHLEPGTGKIIKIE